MLTSITGINWGDEGKGRMVDLLSENADIVARYQGGNNADTPLSTNSVSSSSICFLRVFSVRMSSTLWAAAWLSI